jgi:oxygen-independent coproporphyrinogen-3 oxidase
MGYTTKPATDTVAFGISGIGDLQGAYVQNIKEHDAYYAAVREGRLPVFRGVELSADDRIRRHVIMQLMCNFHLDRQAVERQFDLDFASNFASELEALQRAEQDGFVQVRPDSVTVTPVGRIFIRNLCMIFDRYLDKSGAKPVFSKTI